MPNITFNKITKSYKGKKNQRHEFAIKDLSLSIQEGEFVVIVGPSGCGKSTLLRMLAGLETITSGEILINNQIINKLEPAERNIAMVFQNYALYPHMSIFDNMAYGLKNRKTPKKEIKQRVNDVAEMLEITKFLGRRPKELSGGQRQRVAMGRAIVRQPDFFLFDEPLSNLDAKLRVQMRLEIKRLQKRLGITTIYVTHDQVEAMTLADKLVVINQGNIEQVGKPMDVYHYPESKFVGKFIGSPSMEFVSATLEQDKQHITLKNNELLNLGGFITNRKTGEQLMLGIRPEHWHPENEALNFEERSTMSGVLHIIIDLIEKLGADTLIYGTLKGTKERISVKLFGEKNYKEGTELAIRMRSCDISIFDPITKQRIHIKRKIPLSCRSMGGAEKSGHA